MASDGAPRFSSKDAVVCRGVGKIWAAGTKRAHEALRDIDLDIEPGEFVVFLGPSGCGKSTLLYLISGLEDATEGQIWSYGDKVETPSPDRSLIFQETSLFPWLTVWQNVSFGLAIRGLESPVRAALLRVPGRCRSTALHASQKGTEPRHHQVLGCAPSAPCGASCRF